MRNPPAQLLATVGAAALLGAALAAPPAGATGPTTRAPAATPTCSSYDYPTFDAPLAAALSVNGDAAVVGTEGAKVLRVTPADIGMAGSVFTTERVDLSDDGSFSTAFDFRFSEQVYGGGDGLVFAIQGKSAQAVGWGGDGIGYKSIPQGVGILFDSFDNRPTDPEYVAVSLNGGSVPVVSVLSPVLLDDPAVVHRAWVDYDGATDRLEVRLADAAQRPAAATLTTSIDLPALLGGVTDGYIGFTSGTGAAWANHDVHRWTLRTCYQPVDGPPAVRTGGPYAGQEGTAVPLTGTVTGVTSDPITSGWDWAADSADLGAGCAFADASALVTTVTCTDDGTYTLTLTADDGVHDPEPVSTTLTVSNAAPVVAPLSGPTLTGACTVSVATTFTDAGNNDTHTASLDWGDGSSSAAPVAAGSLSATHAYTTSGTFTVTATVRDDNEGTGTASGSVTTKNTAGPFGQPVAGGARRSTFMVGNTLPLKVTIRDCSGTAVTTLTPTVQLDRFTPGSDPTTPVDTGAIIERSTNGKAMTWLTTAYHYTLSTHRSTYTDGDAVVALGPGTYRITVDDPTLHTPARAFIDLRARR